MVKTTKRPTANIIFNDKKLKAFALKSIIKQGCPLLPLFFKIVPETLIVASKAKGEIKCIQIRNEDIKSLFAGNMQKIWENSQKTPMYSIM